jgi:hypothetical protein
MTTPEPRILDLTALDRAHDRPGGPDGSDLHMLRLALDLQLDAMLLTLGASAQAESRTDGDQVPWRRWLVEDLDLARALAGVLLEGDAAPVPGLGGGFVNGSVTASLDNLVARYSSMEQLLTGVLERRATGQHWRGAATEALYRCRSRLDELHRHRRDVIAGQPAPVAFLPGELLG